MKKFIIVILALVLLTGHLQEALILVYVLGAWAALFWVFRKIGIFSAPRRISNAAGNAVRREYNKSVLREIIRKEIRRR